MSGLASSRRRWTRRDFFRRSGAAGLLAIGGPTIVSACTSVETGNTLDNAKESGKIKIGIAGESPYGFTDGSGKVTGEAPEVARMVFKNLGINEVQAEQVAFDGLIQGLNARQFDVVAAGMNIKPERCENAAFSIPDYSTLTAFLVPKGNPQQIKTFDDIVAKKVNVAVLSGAVEKDYAADAGVPDGQVVTLGAQDDMFRAVVDNRAYCAALTDISLKDLVKKDPAAPVEVTEGFDPVINGQKVLSAGAFVFRKDDNSIREAFNTELKKLHESGEWVRITEPFGFTEANLPKPDVTTEKLCASG